MTPASVPTWAYKLPNAWGDNRYAAHQALWRAFPHDEPQKQAAPFLFRVETDVVHVRARQAPEGFRSHADVLDWVQGDMGRLRMHINVHRRSNGVTLQVRHGDVLPFVERVLHGMGVDVVDADLSILPFRVQTRTPVFPVSVDAGIRVRDTAMLSRAYAWGVGRVKHLGFGMPILSR